MSAAATLQAGPGAAGAPAGTKVAPVAATFNFKQTESFPPLLKQLGASLFVTTYQANKLLVLREQRGGISALVRTFERPMGLAVDPRRIALGTMDQVWQFRNAPDVAPQLQPAHAHDACFVPRSSHVTGDIGVHEIAWAGAHAEELWVVNTRFSCLCTLNPDYSFVPRWRPPFISALAAEDRCHLNGLAMVAGKPRYVTALGETDAERGWRASKPHGGCVMELPSGRFVVRGLSMPHSPRWHAGRLWVLESGTGRILCIDPDSGQLQPVADVPGFARGLAIAGDYAFVGLSKIRATSAMDGVPLAQRRDELKCGVSVVDLRNGSICATLEFETAVEEIFDVQLLPGLRFPEVMGFQKDDVHHTFIVPPNC
jgi:uncharacterized protein (TIGR03032 family)